MESLRHMENSSPIPQPTVQSAPINTQQTTNSNLSGGQENLSSKNKIKDLAIGLVGTVVIYGIASLLWGKMAYAIFAPSLEASGEDFPGIIFFGYIILIPIFVIIGVIFWKSRRNLATGIVAGAILTALYFFATCSMTLAPDGCLGLLL